MKTFFLSIVLLISSTQLFAQQIPKDSLTGSWKVINSQVVKNKDMQISAEEMPLLEMMSMAFVNSKFTFNGNAKFTLDFPENSKLNLEELKFLNNKSWTLKANNVVQVGSDSENLMKIMISQKDNKVFFFLDDTPVLLEMVKL
jgi:hypothetical protein